MFKWIGIGGALLLAGCGKGPVTKDTGSSLPGAPTSGIPESPPAAGPSIIAQAADRPRVLIIGTSLTAGLGLDESDAYPAVLQRLADSAGFHVSIVNAGLSGETSAGALRRVEWLLREPVAVVMIETGANDGLRGLDVDSTAANLRALVRAVRARAPNASVLLAQMEAPPNLGATYTSRFHGMYPAVAREFGASLVPFLLEGVAGTERLNQADGIHPTKAGAQIVARNVWRSLQPQILRLDRGLQGR